MASSGRPGNEQLMFCHNCENEWYKEPDTITCPQCQSDFTEMIENEFDPHPPAADNPLASHNPWSAADDPDEADIDEFSRVPGSSWRDSRNERDRLVNARGGPYAQTGDPIFGQFASMIQGMTGNQRNPNFYPPRPQQPYGLFPPLGSQPLPGQRMGRSVSETRSGPGYQSFSRTYGGNGGGGIHIQFSSSSGRGGGWQTQNQEFDNFQELFGSLFGNVGPPPGARGMAGQPDNPLAALFGSLMGHGNGQQGDAVYSQEAFDRIMSQLMEQHQSGGAPGPATEAAIHALPKKKVTEAMLDETTHQAECSICMDNVTVGEEVVVLPCSHWFHFACAEAWLKEHDTCPVCRAGITPKEGSRDTARAPTEEPLHDEDPFLLARRESGTRDHPFVVPESPTSDRRRPNPRRHSSDQRASSSRPYTNTSSRGGGGITDWARNLFSSNGGSGQNDGDSRPR